MILQRISLIFLLLLVSSTTQATEYVYRDLMANTLPSLCMTESAAQENAQKQYTVDKYSKIFCQKQGYGWHVEGVKSTGKLLCTDCKGETGNKKQCHLEDVVVTCKRIKPGSVGMLPGQS
jgi:hypothetical protein